MKNLCVVTDFDGTVTEKDTLYTFFSVYATDKWKEVEQNWVSGLISSKECLIQEFSLVPNLDENLIQTFLKTVTIDKYFKDFYRLMQEKNIDLYIVSDGVDYFINSVLKTFDLDYINVVANHGEFSEGKFNLSFPNNKSVCRKDSGTCKCHVVKELRNLYENIIYVGDGVSDYCVADKADFLFAKSKLLNYCIQNNIKHISYSNYNDIILSKLF